VVSKLPSHQLGGTVEHSITHSLHSEHLRSQLLEFWTWFINFCRRQDDKKSPKIPNPKKIPQKWGNVQLFQRVRMLYPMMQVFCARDAGNINVKIPCFADNREVAPIHLAAENGHVETVIALLDQFKADISLKDSDGNTPLHCVVLDPYHPYRMRDRDFFYATAKVSFILWMCAVVKHSICY